VGIATVFQRTCTKVAWSKDLLPLRCWCVLRVGRTRCFGLIFQNDPRSKVWHGESLLSLSFQTWPRRKTKQIVKSKKAKNAPRVAGPTERTRNSHPHQTIVRKGKRDVLGILLVERGKRYKKNRLCTKSVNTIEKKRYGAHRGRSGNFNEPDPPRGKTSLHSILSPLRR